MPGDMQDSAISLDGLPLVKTADETLHCVKARSEIFVHTTLTAALLHERR
jgi:hypothetical protein